MELSLEKDRKYSLVDILSLCNHSESLQWKESCD